MKKLLIIVLAIGFLMPLSTVAWMTSDQPGEEQIKPAELIINLTSDVTEHPQSSLMALHFAEKALEEGLEVTIFMNVLGVKLASKNASTITFNNENLHEILKRIIEKGGNVVACPMCMKLQGISEADLAEGIEVSGAGMMMQKLKENPTVFTY